MRSEDSIKHVTDDLSLLTERPCTTVVVVGETVLYDNLIQKQLLLPLVTDNI